MSQSNQDGVNQSMKTTVGDVYTSGENNTTTFNNNQTVNNNQTTRNFNFEYVLSEEKEKLIKKYAASKPFKQESPYRGFKSFGIDDKKSFFGRDLLSEQLLDAVEQNNLVLVLGASGSGKSSIVRAGLISRWKEQRKLKNEHYYDFIFTPGDHPFASLHQGLNNNYKINEGYTSMAKNFKIDTFKNAVEKIKNSKLEKWLFFIDQFEEIFNVPDEKEGHIFIQSLNKLTELNDPSIKIVLAMRSDFLGKFEINPNLSKLVNENKVEMIGDMTPEELREAIEQPAAEHGVIFEDGLVKQIIDDINGTDRDISIQKGYLPFLQYTLYRLWCAENLSPIHRQLTRRCYSKIGGIGGSLKQQVQDIYSHFTEEEKVLSRTIFLNLFDIKAL
ncbi:hypothetical protein VB714_04110, partial [Spirulina sp. 06S082]